MNWFISILVALLLGCIVFYYMWKNDQVRKRK